MYFRENTKRSSKLRHFSGSEGVSAQQVKSNVFFANDQTVLFPVDEGDAGNVLAGDEKLKDFSPRTGPSRSFSYTKTASAVYELSKIGLSYTETAFPVYGMSEILF